MTIERISPANDPRKFSAFMRDVLSLPTPDYPASDITSEKLLAKGKELEGHFRGDMAEQVAQWQEEGLGRLVRVPQIIGNVYERVDDRDHFYDLIYALPHTEATKPPIDAALLIFSNYGANNLVLVEPKKSTSTYPSEAARETHHNIGSFNAFFAPGTYPSLNNQWRLVYNQAPSVSFVKNPGAFSARVVEYISNPKRRTEALDRALVSARRFKFNA